MAKIIEEKKKFTYQDYLKLQGDEYYEIIQGELIMMTPAPSIVHQRISRKIEFLLEKYILENNLGEIFYAPCDVILDNENVVQPDIFFISKERNDIITEKNIQGAPDLIIEIVSENTSYRDLIQKKVLYANFKVKEYWLVIPEEKSIEIDILKGNEFELYKKYKIDDKLESPLLNGFSFHLKDIF